MTWFIITMVGITALQSLQVSSFLIVNTRLLPPGGMERYFLSQRRGMDEQVVGFSVFGVHKCSLLDETNSI